MRNSKENLKVLIVSTKQDFLDGATDVFFVYKNSFVIFPDDFFYKISASLELYCVCTVQLCYSSNNLKDF